MNWERVIWQGEGSTVLVRARNPHSQRWDPKCTETRDATYWEEIIDEPGLVIVYDHQPTDYWTRHNSMGGSVIHLTLANLPFGEWMILDGSHTTQLDHMIIEWILEMENHDEEGGTEVVRWNLAARSQEDVEVAEQLWRQQAKDRAHLGAESTGDEVDSEAEWCQEALRKVIDATVKQIMSCVHPN